VPTTRGLSRSEIARRLLCVQYKTALANFDGAIAGVSSEPLHDLRVALRRSRLLLILMQDDWPKTRSLQRGLKQISDALGPARDRDVWIEYLKSDRVCRQMERDPAWPRYFQHQQFLRNQQANVVAQVLRGDQFEALRGQMNIFLRSSLPASRPKAGPWKRWIDRKFKSEMRRMWRLRSLRHSEKTGDLHRLRIALRRARYMAEYAESKKWVRRLHRCERPLAQVHDVDMTSEHLSDAPEKLGRVLRRERSRNLQRLSRAWRRLK
jgi:CHAD domain-containing protein